MKADFQNPFVRSEPLPVEIVLHPSWWYEHAGIIFDEDFYYHPVKRVESERRMEEVLHERYGEYGLGSDHNQNLPVIGAVHNAAGFLLPEMLGCEIHYRADAAPDVVPAARESLQIDTDKPFLSPAFKRFERLKAALKTRYGSVVGDVNWGGVLNLAMDLRGQEVFMDMIDEPEKTRMAFCELAGVLERFVDGVQAETGSSSISVNRTVRHFEAPVYLHSECSHTMISTADYEQFLMPIDAEWSVRHRPFGIHHCGKDPHRFAELYARLPNLDFLDVGWGGDVAVLRQHLPKTFLNIRLDPVAIRDQTAQQIRETIVRLVQASRNPWLTGICCINMDQSVTDAQISAIFETVKEMRRGYLGLTADT